MRTDYSTQNWGYKILTDTCINFYHILLPSLSDEFFYENISAISFIQRNTDESITVHLKNSSNAQDTVTSLLDICYKKALIYCETPKHYYKIPSTLRQSFLSWAIAFEGCLAILLSADQLLQQYIKGNWEYINAHTGGIFLPPYTLLLYPEYPKIIHPVTVHNYKQRSLIEQKATFYIRKMFHRMLEAQVGHEGIALLSMVEEKTHIPTSLITQIIDKKSVGVKTHTYSPFFSQIYQ